MIFQDTFFNSTIMKNHKNNDDQRSIAYL